MLPAGQQIAERHPPLSPLRREPWIKKIDSLTTAVYS